MQTSPKPSDIEVAALREALECIDSAMKALEDVSDLTAQSRTLKANLQVSRALLRNFLMEHSGLPI